MTMITTCPACRTAFRVTREQLDARMGKVRCGKCATIFDGREALKTGLPERAPESGDSPENRPGHAKPAAIPEPAQMAAGPPAASNVGDVTRAPSGANLPPAPPAGQLDAVTPYDMDLAFPAAGPERARRTATWAAGSALLALVLMTQLAFHYRGEFALLVPEMRPALARLCTSLGCDLPLPRRAELISIESSDLQADPGNPGVMVLTATLRNRAAFAQSHPSLELTLTDSQDQPLARRVLAAQDYLGRSASLEAGFPGNSELPIKVYMDASSLKATGYRLYLFFP